MINLNTGFEEVRKPSVKASLSFVFISFMSIHFVVFLLNPISFSLPAFKDQSGNVKWSVLCCRKNCHGDRGSGNKDESKKDKNRKT